MLSTLEKAKALKEFRGLRVALVDGALKTLEKAKSLKRFRELRVLLGGEKQTVEPEPMAQPTDHTPFLQSLINNEVSVVMDKSLADKLYEIKDQSDPDLVMQATIAAVRQVAEANGYVVID